METAEVVIDGSNSYDPEGESLSYLWQQLSGPNVLLNQDAGATLSFTAPMVESDQQLVFTLTVNDGVHDSLASEVTVNVIHNQVPVALAGSDKAQANAGETVTLDATASTDPEGANLTYHWQQTSGTAVELSSAVEAIVSFSAPELNADEQLSFELIVSDGLRQSDPVSLTITVKKKASDNDASNGNGSNSSSDSGGGSTGLICLLLLPIVLVRRRRATIR
jgi:hypothetical protein